ncbi:MAG: YciI family protein [Kineosporiaceae bacterium]
MKYMILINLGPRARDWANLPPEEQKEIASAWEAIRNTPGVTPGLQLQPPDTATTVRLQGGRTLTTDGPFVETKEALDGYCLFEADDLDAAIQFAARIPAARMGGAIEVRPVAEW